MSIKKKLKKIFFKKLKVESRNSTEKERESIIKDSSLSSISSFSSDRAYVQPYKIEYDYDKYSYIGRGGYSRPNKDMYYADINKVDDSKNELIKEFKIINAALEKIKSENAELDRDNTRLEEEIYSLERQNIVNEKIIQEINTSNNQNSIADFKDENRLYKKIKQNNKQIIEKQNQLAKNNERININNNFLYNYNKQANVSYNEFSKTIASEKDSDIIQKHVNELEQEIDKSFYSEKSFELNPSFSMHSNRR
ncbi:MAG: DUF3450 domain-containing protein [Pseudobutyrivibrio sp.]|nr:DUF3450 domain-containing protein [Pseudobutyrivibrio sp.]